LTRSTTCQHWDHRCAGCLTLHKPFFPVKHSPSH
jgi:hypothetical protein